MVQTPITNKIAPKIDNPLKSRGYQGVRLSRREDFEEQNRQWAAGKRGSDAVPAAPRTEGGNEIWRNKADLAQANFHVKAKSG